MSDSNKSTPSTPSLAGWHESSGFRETFLVKFTERGHATALSIVASMLFDYANESARHWPDLRESTTRTELRAAAADLRWLSKYLAAVGRERELSSLDPPDQTLSELAGRLAAEVVRLVEILDLALGPVVVPR